MGTPIACCGRRPLHSCVELFHCRPETLRRKGKKGAVAFTFLVVLCAQLCDICIHSFAFSHPGIIVVLFFLPVSFSFLLVLYFASNLFSVPEFNGALCMKHGLRN